MEQVDRGRLENHLDDLSYPVTRADAAVAFAETEVVAGDDAANLGRLISEMGSDAFRSSGELADEIESALPTHDAG